MCVVYSKQGYKIEHGRTTRKIIDLLLAWFGIMVGHCMSQIFYSYEFMILKSSYRIPYKLTVEELESRYAISSQDHTLIQTEGMRHRHPSSFQCHDSQFSIDKWDKMKATSKFQKGKLRVHMSNSLWLSAILCGGILPYLELGKSTSIWPNGLLGRMSWSLFLMVVTWPH